MGKGVLVVFSNPIEPSREAEYNKWYDEIHVPDVVALPGFTGARRFKNTGIGGPASHGYLAIYDYDGEPDKAMAALGAGVQSGAVRMADAPLQMDPPPAMVVWEQIS
ncbi:MAG: hypothetical protein AB7L13_19060 [Acidimicrobiia bacterium]